METVDASAVIVGVSLATLLMIIRVQSVLQDVLKAAIELASAKPATAAAETQTGVQVQDIWPGPATHNRVRQRNERAPDARYTVEAIYAMDCLWDQLSADEKTAAAVLGYDQDGWDKKIPTNVSMTPWDELGVQCQLSHLIVCADDNLLEDKARTVNIVHHAHDGLDHFANALVVRDEVPPARAHLDPEPALPARPAPARSGARVRRVRRVQYFWRMWQGD